MKENNNISVVIVSYNYEEGISYYKKLDKMHKGSDLEFILVFKKSIKQNLKLDQINCKIKIHKQNGKGIYNAMNIGYKLSSKKWVIFSNVGDTLLRIPKNLNDRYSINCFPVNILSESGNFIYIRKMQKFMPSHQGMFFNKNKLKNLYFDEKLNYAADLDLFLKNKLESIFFDSDPVSNFYLGGVSNSYKLNILIKRKLEWLIVLLKNLRYIFGSMEYIKKK